MANQQHTAKSDCGCHFTEFTKAKDLEQSLENAKYMHLEKNDKTLINK